MYTTTAERSSSTRTRTLLSVNTIRVLIHTGFPISWMPLRGAYHLSVLRVSESHFTYLRWFTVASAVTEMLLAILATCSPEELEDTEIFSEGGDAANAEVTDLAFPPSDVSVRRQAIKNKILAVGKMQRVFQLLRSVVSAI